MRSTKEKAELCRALHAGAEPTLSAACWAVGTACLLALENRRFGSQRGMPAASQAGQRFLRTLTNCFRSPELAAMEQVLTGPFTHQRERCRVGGMGRLNGGLERRKGAKR